ncbi:hypothetical protein YC2023_070395 [Brassica napus]
MKVVKNERGSDGKKATETDKESDSSTREDGAYARRMSAFVSRFSGKHQWQTLQILDHERKKTHVIGKEYGKESYNLYVNHGKVNLGDDEHKSILCVDGYYFEAMRRMDQPAYINRC